jgi:flavin reductase (DIM6/NTAB) family NADH-FMN oxidoreductase RutF
MTIETDFFRQVMGQFTSGVTVVTTRSKEGLAGLTVSSFCSLSLDPPLVLICIDLRSTALPFIRDSGTFVVNILTNRQEHLSRCFATNSEERYEYFCHASYHTAATGSPVLDDVLAFIDTRIVAEYPGGDHAIFVGQVVAMGSNGQVAFANEADTVNCTLPQCLDDEAGEDRHPRPTERKLPLAYYRGQYRHLARDYQRPSLAAFYDEDFE